MSPDVLIPVKVKPEHAAVLARSLKVDAGSGLPADSVESEKDLRDAIRQLEQHGAWLDAIGWGDLAEETTILMPSGRAGELGGFFAEWAGEIVAEQVPGTTEEALAMVSLGYALKFAVWHAEQERRHANLITLTAAERDLALRLLTGEFVTPGEAFHLNYWPSPEQQAEWLAMYVEQRDRLRGLFEVADSFLPGSARADGGCMVIEGRQVLDLIASYREEMLQEVDAAKDGHGAMHHEEQETLRANREMYASDIAACSALLARFERPTHLDLDDDEREAVGEIAENEANQAGSDIQIAGTSAHAQAHGLVFDGAARAHFALRLVEASTTGRLPLEDGYYNLLPTIQRYRDMYREDCGPDSPNATGDAEHEAKIRRHLAACERIMARAEATP